MNIPPVVEILSLAVLLLIAAELYIIARELSRGVTFLLKDRESREAGQTINVNLAPSQTGSPTALQGTTLQGTTLQSATIAPTGDSPLRAAPLLEETPAASVRETVIPALKSAPSGQFAVKCSRCQAENSSYRHECFNCGGSL